MIALAIVAGVGRRAGGAVDRYDGRPGDRLYGLRRPRRHAGAVRRYSVHLEWLRSRNAPFAVAGLVMPRAGRARRTSSGLAAIIGAFLAGMIFAETREQYALEHQTLPVYELLVPMFFVITGASVDWRVFLDGSLLGLALAVTALAIVTKLVGCGLGAAGLGPRAMAIVGVGMAPRGEVGLIVASIGQSLHALPEAVFSVVVVMSVLTTLVVPPLLPLLFRGHPGPTTRPTDEDLAVQDGRLPDL